MPQVLTRSASVGPIQNGQAKVLPGPGSEEGRRNPGPFPIPLITVQTIMSMTWMHHDLEEAFSGQSYQIRIFYGLTK